ncbi:MAG TPA: glycosyltransferase [Thermoanaerobaculia bacterium]|nr:glycosyltransferase [Thermoanaerobaculia bacterium]
MSELSQMRVAVVHDWLTGQRGGEHVLEAILELVPSAEIFTLFHFPGRVSAAIERHPIRTSALQAWALRVPDYRHLLPFFPRAVERWDLSGFDLVISSSHCVAKGVQSEAPHLSYCHTPMRYIWDRFDDYFPRSRPLRRMAGKAIAPWLRRWDRASSSRVDHFVANSAFVADRIRRFYGREAEVIHPFVDARFFEPPLRQNRESFHLVLSALVPYKRIDLAIEAAARGGERLIIAGSGPGLEELSKKAGPNVELRGWVTDGEILDLLSRATSLIIPGIEDFGITALEALASGTPVVSIAAGGVPESIVHESSGILLEEMNAESLLGGMREAASRPWDRAAMRARAEGFSRRRFQDELRNSIQRVVAGGRRG